MKWNLSLTTIIFFILAYYQSAFSTPSKNPYGTWFLTVGSGVYLQNLPSEMNVVNSDEAPPPYNIDRYSIHSESNALFTIFGGKQWLNRRFWIPSYSFGIAWQYVFNNTINGQISEYSLPEMTNYYYHFNVNSNLLLVSGKINLLQFQNISPYFQGGIGVSFNEVSNYKETALPGIIPRESPRFSNTTKNNFAFNIGTGIDMQMNPQWIFSIGYLYQNIGSIYSNQGLGTWSNDVLGVSTFKGNEILATLTFAFV